MQSLGRSIGGSAQQPFGFEFVDFHLEDLLDPAPVARKVDDEDAAEIDYGRLQSAIKRNREWFR